MMVAVVVVMMIVLMVVTMARNLCIKSNYGDVCDGVCNDDNDDLLIVENNLCVVMTLPGPITRGSPRRTYSEATAAATLSPTMPTVPTPTAATVWGSTIMVGQVDEVGGEPGLWRISA